MFSSILLQIINLCHSYLASETRDIQVKAHKIIHQAARFTIGHYGFKLSIQNIMSSIDWKMPDEFISQTSARFLHKIIITETPKPLFNMIRFPRTRLTPDIPLLTQPRTQRLERTAIAAAVNNYNRIPTNIKNLPPVKLKLKLLQVKLNHK